MINQNKSMQLLQKHLNLYSTSMISKTKDLFCPQCKEQQGYIQHNGKKLSKYFVCPVCLLEVLQSHYYNLLTIK